MKVLFGIEVPERGKILLSGEEIQIKSSADAIQYGIGMVRQHFMLVDSLTVAENIVLGLKSGFGRFSYDEAVNSTVEISNKYGQPIDPHAKIHDLPVGMKQRVEILKALIRGAEILILDEPTAVLTPQETSELFTQLMEIKLDGHTIIFITHKLNEVKKYCDRVTVMRSGKTIGVYNTNEVTEQEISKLMIGRDLSQIGRASCRERV